MLAAVKYRIIVWNDREKECVCFIFVWHCEQHMFTVFNVHWTYNDWIRLANFIWLFNLFCLWQMAERYQEQESFETCVGSVISKLNVIKNLSRYRIGTDFYFHRRSFVHVSLFSLTQTNTPYTLIYYIVSSIVSFISFCHTLKKNEHNFKFSAKLNNIECSTRAHPRCYKNGGK